MSNINKLALCTIMKRTLAMNKALQKNSITWNIDSPTILKRILLGVCLFFAVGVSSTYAAVIYSAINPGQSGSR